MSNLISVIIPCYQQGRFLNDAVTSLQAQTYTHWEAIIVNDGSMDETESIARMLCAADSRVHYVSKPNGGLSSARNAGLALASGHWIQFLDADDQLDTLKFETQLSILRDRPNVDIIYGNAKYFFDGAFGHFSRGPYANGPGHDWIAEAWADSRSMLIKLIERNLLPVCSPLMRSSVVKKVGFFNEKLNAMEDWEYWIRCAIIGVQFQFIDAYGTDSLIRMHRASMTQNVYRMHLSVYQVRLFCHELLPLSETRNFNLASLLLTGSVIDMDRRAVRYSRILLVCRSVREYMIITISFLCDYGGPLNAIAHRIGRCFPAWLRHRLSVIGLGFANS